jgi:23S rRNA pseudouridine1911/1915/1917 synthase
VRLDLAVSRAFGLSRRTAREAVRAGRVDVGGATVQEPGTAVEAETRIDYHPERPLRRRSSVRLSVLYEDGDVLVVDKPAGLLTVPTQAREKDTLWGRAIHYLQQRYGGRPYAGIVHRLDKDTSGALAFARNRDALHFLQECFRRHAIEREYLALVDGAAPEEGLLDADLVAAPGLRRTIARPGESGRRAITRYRTVERLAGASLLSIRPETGRTHQIRVHLAAAGHPILGDRVYAPPGGAAAKAAPRQMLHARALGFTHPRTGRPVRAEAPIPEDLAAVLAHLRERQKKRPGQAGPRRDRNEPKATRERR